MESKITWQEITKKYPDQWVSLVDVEKTDEGKLKAGVVTASGEDLQTVMSILKREKYPSDCLHYTGAIKNFLGVAKWDVGNAQVD